ncbi:MAG: hypothetical protein FWD55_08395 [Propionibacteriaceae bacterium]|nr:hypothetical protein [Propionibacteriaceae bacterium]
MMEPKMTRQEALDTLATMSNNDFPTVSPEDDIDDKCVASLIADAYRLSAGRPSLSSPGKHSPRLNFRVPQTVKDRLTEVALEQDRRESDIAREALYEYLGIAA